MKLRIYLEKLLPQDFESFYTLTGNIEVMAMITERALSKEEAYTTVPNRDAGMVIPDV